MDRTETIFYGDGTTEVIHHDVDWESIRYHRDAILTASDWRAVKDRVLPNEWKEYRQALRDLPQNHDEANDAADSWPTPPE